MDIVRADLDIALRFAAALDRVPDAGSLVIRTAHNTYVARPSRLTFSVPPERDALLAAFHVRNAARLVRRVDRYPRVVVGVLECRQAIDLT